MTETENKSSNPFSQRKAIVEQKDDSSTVKQVENENEISEIEDERPDELNDSPENEAFENINSSLKIFSDELKRLNSFIADRLSYDNTKEKAFEQLYGDLENLKRDREFESLRPFFTDLILFYDRIKNIEEGLSYENKDLKPSFVATLESISTELIEILARRDVKIIKTSSSTFDPKIQKVIDVHNTGAEDQNNKVIKIVRRGFVYRDRIIRPEEVIIQKVSIQS